METVVNRGFRGASIEIVDHYNLDAILSVGYRVNSKNATAFRIWANYQRPSQNLILSFKKYNTIVLIIYT